MEQSEQRIERLERLVSDLDSRVALMERPARDASARARTAPGEAGPGPEPGARLAP